jgi:hypothetical protein
MSNHIDLTTGAYTLSVRRTEEDRISLHVEHDDGEVTIELDDYEAALMARQLLDRVAFDGLTDRKTVRVSGPAK